MSTMKLVLGLAALLLLGAQQTVAQPTAGYGVAGVGTTIDGSGYNVHVNWVSPGDKISKGGVNLTEWKKGRVVYRVATDKNTLPKMISVTAGLKVSVWAYVKGFTVKYSSLGSCGPTLNSGMAEIVVTVTDAHLTVECPGKSYSFSGDVKPNNSIKLQRVK